MEKKRIGVIGLPPPEIELKLKEELGDDVELIDLQDTVSLKNNFYLMKSKEVMQHLEVIRTYEECDYLGLTKAQRYANISPARNSSVDPKINRNDNCPCGSGKKYKKCCNK